ncbi:sulfate ABC transporter ATP-binding protein [Fulvimarina endophytica]|uniref:Sulfate ABC transporter ATP-binding protein n=1 Tax=Fulvimarina endophytica TaxID=2293836 RepID=A0A371WXX0_9HYPH|nr:sulfate/molybdate ABC transporter ATP-binding protein [Fulvimarina endophytica]RFC61799.1 sulfate ABC transporter ATP-binding protein [Fulvimarina endophytica]
MDISVRELRKTFDRYPALHDVSLDIQSGELIALLGPSGSGKTTLLRLIAGLEFPTSGSIFYGTEDASGKSVRDRQVGFVFQHYALFKHMTVADNIGFGLKVRDRSKRPSSAEIRRRASDLLDLVQLPGLEDRYPSQLSGGQRQRVALARALAIEPRVLLLDEPFGALDAKVRKELRRWLRELHERTGHTTIFVTHDQEEALELSDRVVVMSQGRIEQVGTPDEIYDTPATPFVFSFIGDSSEIPISVSGGEAHVGNRSIGVFAEGLPDGPARLFVRPHDLDLVSDDPQTIAAVVTAVRRNSGSRFVEAEIDGCRSKVEIELPADDMRVFEGRIALKPKRWKIFPDAKRPNSQSVVGKGPYKHESEPKPPDYSQMVS